MLEVHQSFWNEAVNSDYTASLHIWSVAFRKTNFLRLHLQRYNVDTVYIFCRSKRNFQDLYGRWNVFSPDSFEWIILTYIQMERDSFERQFARGHLRWRQDMLLGIIVDTLSERRSSPSIRKATGNNDIETSSWSPTDKLKSRDNTNSIACFFHIVARTQSATLVRIIAIDLIRKSNRPILDL